MENFIYKNYMANQDNFIARRVLGKEFGRWNEFGDDDILAHCVHNMHEFRKTYTGTQKEYASFAKEVARKSILEVIDKYTTQN